VRPDEPGQPSHLVTEATEADEATNASEATEIVPIEATLPHHASLAQREIKQIGDYIVDELLGEGGGGKVFAARHVSGGVRVAIKVLRPEMVPLPHLVTRFNREVEAIQKIQHPNIVQVIETGRTEVGQPYYVMELLEGVNLRRLLQLHGRFSPPEVLDLITPVCNAIQAVHEAGFVHRDVKASNVHVTDVQGRRSVKLLDFGIAKSVHGEAAGQGLTEPGVKLGSAHTMAPEQVRCERLDARSDIYALGVVLFQLLTGEYPFDADDPRHIAFLHLQAPAPRPSTRAAISPVLDAVVLRCLEKQAERRFSNADELLVALQAAIGTHADAEPERDCSALGALLTLATPEDTELDDAMLEDMANVLDQVEQCLSNHGFAFPLHTATALLAVRVPKHDADASRDAEELRYVLIELLAALSDRIDPHPGVRVSLSLRVDSVRCRLGGSEREIVGGSLLELGSWGAEHQLHA
jgi:serine/threonine protein kinase